ncbi:hypothetical protein UYO_2542 [Lachnospiraceae bacterium JC7]|nr:hypothetical protein UYO_2542 [Lachnospiraceae bacterium JC7]
MSSVTKIVDDIKQPRGGYLRTNYFAEEQLDDGEKLYGSETINAGLVGLAVDYMCRYLISTDKKKSFEISLRGAKIIDSFRKGEFLKAEELLEQINGLDDESIKAACKLVGYDVCYRDTIEDYKRSESIVADGYTVSNIRIMIERGLSFLQERGPVTSMGFTFEGGYSETVSSGDGDYLTHEGMWDFKTSGNAITSKETLQLLIYFLMGKHSGQDRYKDIKTIGFFNPRKNLVSWTDVSFIPQSTIDIVNREVIKYT